MSENRPRHPLALGQLSATEGGTDLDISPTIVGGQPPRKNGRPAAMVPVGVERVMYLAAVDPVFRGRLLEDREAATAEQGLSLSASERLLLRAIPVAQLAAVIDGMDTSPGNVERRTFLRAVAAGSMVLAVGGSACGDDTKDVGPKKDLGPDMGKDQGRTMDGIRPDMPGSKPEASVPDRGPSMDGIRPDMPGSGDKGRITSDLASWGIRPGG